MRRYHVIPAAAAALALALLILPRPAAAAPTGNPAYTDPASTDADFPFQGEYSGEVPVGGSPLKLGVQVVALGDGAFDVVEQFLLEIGPGGRLALPRSRGGLGVDAGDDSERIGHCCLMPRGASSTWRASPRFVGA
jgi:hypothetical protein